MPPSRRPARMEPRRLGRRGVALLGSVIAVALLGACSGDPDVLETGTAPPVPSSRVVPSLGAKEIAPFGLVLVDDQLRTLYVNADEKGGVSACDATCLAAWPLVLAASADAKPTTSDGVMPSLVSTSDMGGAIVVTYAGYPLHAYVGDSAPGDANGEGTQGIWSGITVAGTPG